MAPKRRSYDVIAHHTPWKCFQLKSITTHPIERQKGPLQTSPFHVSLSGFLKKAREDKKGPIRTHPVTNRPIVLNVYMDRGGRRPWIKIHSFIKGFPDPLAALQQQERGYRELYSLVCHCPGDVRPWPGNLPSYTLGGWRNKQTAFLRAGEWNKCPEQTEFGHSVWGRIPFAGIPVCPFKTLGLSDFTWVFPKVSTQEHEMWVTPFSR